MTTSAWSGLLRGAAAGAAGTTARNAVTTLDVAVRDRPTGEAPAQVVAALVDRAGVPLPGRRADRERLLAALGPVAGAATGVGIGAAAGALRTAGVRLPTAVGGPLLGLAAMLSSDGPIAALGISDPRRRTCGDRLADAVPHLVYGLTTHAALRAAVPDPGPPPRPAALLRAAALGLASGSRSSAGITAIALTSRSGDRGAAGRLGGRIGRTAAGVLALGEAVADKSPVTPSRTDPPGLAPRAALGAGSVPTCPARSPRTRSPPCSAGSAPAAGTGAVWSIRCTAGGMRTTPAGVDPGMAVTRGFTGRAGARDPRLPPGQYDARDEWPVLHVESTPKLDTARWTFTVEGLVERATTWTWDEIQALPRARYAGDIHCVTTWSKFGMTFDGVSVDTLLDAAGPLPGATHAMALTHSGYTTNLPLADLRGGKAWVVWDADGAPLTTEHGGPARLLVPHLYFWKCAKWVSGLRLMDHDEPGFWERNGYHDRGDPWAEERYQGD